MDDIHIVDKMRKGFREKRIEEQSKSFSSIGDKVLFPYDPYVYRGSYINIKYKSSYDEYDITHSKIYQFQFQVLPELLNNKENNLYSDLINNDNETFFMYTSLYLSLQYYQDIQVFAYSKGVLFIFPTPFSVRESYYIYVFKHNDELEYYLYVKTNVKDYVGNIRKVTERANINISYENFLTYKEFCIKVDELVKR